MFSCVRFRAVDLEKQVCATSVTGWVVAPFLMSAISHTTELET
jgi:hypothetical protein